ncbi:MAG: diguanylate cyclase [Methylophaga sp.]|nr:diguanylate cyclase [Methylophaga sp.]
MKTLLRASDHLGRWGGEECIVLASNTDLAEAEKLAERLCRHINELELETVARISVSIGVTEWKLVI